MPKRRNPYFILLVIFVDILHNKKKNDKVIAYVNLFFTDTHTTIWKFFFSG